MIPCGRSFTAACDVQVLGSVDDAGDPPTITGRLPSRAVHRSSEANTPGTPERLRRRYARCLQAPEQNLGTLPGRTGIDTRSEERRVGKERRARTSRQK